jgi:hypothetical protein
MNDLLKLAIDGHGGAPGAAMPVACLGVTPAVSLGCALVSDAAPGRRERDRRPHLGSPGHPWPGHRYG